MENFVIIKTEKEFGTFPTLEFEEAEASLCEHVDGGHITIITGPSGCGKSSLARKVLRNYTVVDFHADILKSKRETDALFRKIRGTSSVVLFDDFEYDRGVAHAVVEHYSSTGPVVFVMRDHGRLVKEVTGCKVLEMPCPTAAQMATLGRQIFPRGPWPAWEGCSLRLYVMQITALRDSGMVVGRPDEVYSTRESIVDLICTGGRGYERFIGKGIEEHGHIKDLIFTNHNCEDIHEAAHLTDALSRADVMDSCIYEGNWDFLPYYTIDACIVPSKIMGNTLDPHKLKPGSAWTKHYNQKMRTKQLDKLKNKFTNMTFDFETTTYIATIVDNTDAMEMLKHYDITSADMDLMKHLALGNGLKGKNAVHCKKELKQHHGIKSRRGEGRRVG